MDPVREPMRQRSDVAHRRVTSMHRRDRRADRPDTPDTQSRWSPRNRSIDIRRAIDRRRTARPAASIVATAARARRHRAACRSNSPACVRRRAASAPAAEPGRRQRRRIADRGERGPSRGDRLADISRQRLLAFHPVVIGLGEELRLDHVARFLALDEVRENGHLAAGPRRRMPGAGRIRRNPGSPAVPDNAPALSPARAREPA